PVGAAAGSGDPRRTRRRNDSLRHSQDELLQGPAGAVVGGVGAFEGEVEVEKPAVELAGAAAGELDEALFGGGDVAEGPVAEAGLRKGVAEGDFAAGALGLLEDAGGGGVAAERPGERADEGQRMLAGVQQSV